MQTFWLVGHVGEVHLLPQHSTAPEQTGIIVAAESGGRCQTATEQQLELIKSESGIYGNDNNNTSTAGIYQEYSSPTSVPI